ncbi:anthranilate synthase component I family protein [Subtercola frigoramans]|uniref:Anthranilate/para-aminobenzoate synthase component I n=1 Tax=Subtercola frigoramans TaxID=120298 RepID=A0ABS2L6A2_9MICO|nr:anthranilate synthase component I family protein [Subtercola frigoramans]MBM7472631.1 anthranilate/para-aminobenzoate synthase component I [Subtercola frigoramans]
MSRRVVSRTVEGWVKPSAAFAALYRDEPASFWLDSGAHAEVGTSYIGAPGRGHERVSAFGAGTFDALRAAVEEVGPPCFMVTPSVGEIAPLLAGTAASEGLPAFRLGWVGWLAYEIEGSQFMFIDRAVAFDHALHSVTLIALTDDAHASAVSDWFDATSATLLDLQASTARESPINLGQSPTAMQPSTHGPLKDGRMDARWRHSSTEYLHLISECQARIADGEAYQLCLTNQISVTLGNRDSDDPLGLYERLRAINPSHHGGYLRFGDTALLSSSPEQFLVLTTSGLVTTRPIKGTRPRGVTPARDRELRDELLGSEKERAENVMIVDLMRNDLAKVARTGSVRVPTLFDVETYSNVHQLVSTVTAELADGKTGIDAVEACFPAGSMTGAPKASAMAILEHLEQGPRGIYAGAFGYFGLDGRVDLAMSIRSIVIEGANATIGTGGGITALSVPEEELEEIVVKAAPLLDALGVTSGRSPRKV